MGEIERDRLLERVSSSTLASCNDLSKAFIVPNNHIHCPDVVVDEINFAPDNSLWAGTPIEKFEFSLTATFGGCEKYACGAEIDIRGLFPRRFQRSHVYEMNQPRHRRNRIVATLRRSFEFSNTSSLKSHHHAFEIMVFDDNNTVRE